MFIPWMAANVGLKPATLKDCHQVIVKYGLHVQHPIWDPSRSATARNKLHDAYIAYCGWIHMTIDDARCERMGHWDEETREVMTGRLQQDPLDHLFGNYWNKLKEKFERHAQSYREAAKRVIDEEKMKEAIKAGAGQSEKLVGDVEKGDFDRVLPSYEEVFPSTSLHDLRKDAISPVVYERLKRGMLEALARRSKPKEPAPVKAERESRFLTNSTQLLAPNSSLQLDELTKASVSIMVKLYHLQAERIEKAGDVAELASAKIRENLSTLDAKFVYALYDVAYGQNTSEEIAESGSWSPKVQKAVLELAAESRTNPLFADEIGKMSKRYVMLYGVMVEFEAKRDELLASLDVLEEVQANRTN